MKFPAFLKTALRYYAQSWLFLLWSAICILFGAGWMLFAIVSVLKVRGIL